jgi:hypothetical protein
MMRTWQTRPSLGLDELVALDAYAQRYGQAERCLFAELAAGKKSKNELKREYIRRFGITARQFNAIRIGLDGKAQHPRTPTGLDQRTGSAHHQSQDHDHKAQVYPHGHGRTAHQACRQDSSEAAPTGDSGAEEGHLTRRSKRRQGAHLLRLAQVVSSAVRSLGQRLYQS